MEKHRSTENSNPWAAVAVVFLLLYVMGYIRIPGLVLPNWTLFTFQGRPVTLMQLLLIILGLALIERLPSPLRQILYVVIVLWILSVLGFLAISGLPNILVIALLIGLFLAILR